MTDEKLVRIEYTSVSSRAEDANGDDLKYGDEGVLEEGRAKAWQGMGRCRILGDVEEEGPSPGDVWDGELPEEDEEDD